MQRVAKVFVLVLVVVAVLPSVTNGQSMGFTPGKTITIDIKFSGPSVDGITTVWVWSGLVGDLRPGQSGFQRGFSVQAQKVGDVFRATFVVPDNQGAGTYRITQVRAVLGEESDFYIQIDPSSAPTFEIHNDKTVPQPAVSVTVH